MRWGTYTFTRCWRVGDGVVPFRGAGRGANPDRPNFNRHQLHDGVQLAGRDLPDDLSHPRHGADRGRHDRKQC